MYSLRKTVQRCPIKTKILLIKLKLKPKKLLNKRLLRLNKKPVIMPNGRLVKKRTD